MVNHLLPGWQALGSPQVAGLSLVSRPLLRLGHLRLGHRAAFTVTSTAAAYLVTFGIFRVLSLSYIGTLVR